MIVVKTPTPTQHNTTVGFDMKMTVQTTPTPLIFFENYLAVGRRGGVQSPPPYTHTKIHFYSFYKASESSYKKGLPKKLKVVVEKLGYSEQ